MVKFHTGPIGVSLVLQLGVAFQALAAPTTMIEKAVYFARNPADFTVERIQAAFPAQYKAHECAPADLLCNYVSLSEGSRPGLASFGVANPLKHHAGGGQLLLELAESAPCVSQADIDRAIGRPSQKPLMPVIAMTFDAEYVQPNYREYRGFNAQYPQFFVSTWERDGCVYQLALDAKIVP